MQQLLVLIVFHEIIFCVAIIMTTPLSPITDVTIYVIFVSDNPGNVSFLFIKTEYVILYMIYFLISTKQAKLNGPIVLVYD